MTVEALEKKKQFEQMGGREMLKKVSKAFYDLVYDEPWIKEFFKDIDQDKIEAQQVDFMTSALGGGNVYFGRLPVPAHKHMFITEELFELRQKLLIKAMDEVQISDELREKWLKIDDAFKSKLVKNAISDCEKRFNTDEILFFPNKVKQIA